MAQKDTKKRTLRIRRYLLSIIAVAVVALVVLELTNTIHLFRKTSVPPHTASQYTKGQPLKSISDNSSSKSSDSGNSKSNTSNGGALITPTGDFVSSHQDSLSSNGQETSTCNTTPGATCTITFTSGSTVISLPSQTADSGGAAYWTWTPRNTKLTAGSWTIQAVATLGSQKLTANDAMSLEITQ